MGLKEKVKKLPRHPGVYLMKSDVGEILYIGKAKDLSKRVASYFQDRPKSTKLTLLVEKIKDIDIVLTASEEEALIYEANLIKKYKPKYNTELKDDKSFPFLKLTVVEEFPRLSITRKKVDDGSRYFGPYTRVKPVRSALSLLKNIFPLRTCRRIPKHVCLDYHIGQCFGPCVGAIDREHYKEIVGQLILFLEGKKTMLLKDLTMKMNNLSKEERFEEAAIIRNRISALSEIPGRRLREKSDWTDVAIKLKKLLKLGRLPVIVEAFDVSNIMGQASTGSMVYFKNGIPDKTNYRKFKIKHVKEIDDYAMMREIVERRYKRLKEEKKQYPDLIIIDGGKGHLKAGYSVLAKLNLTHIPIIAIAKKEEKIFTLNSKVPLDVNRDSQVLYFIQRIRDEAHRFAIKYHHRLRKKGAGI
ncbi:MAG: excinuclease ABC subunit UvrC [Candidatus Omnitrophota bacterium]